MQKAHIEVPPMVRLLQNCQQLGDASPLSSIQQIRLEGVYCVCDPSLLHHPQDAKVTCPFSPDLEGEYTRSDESLMPPSPSSTIHHCTHLVPFVSHVDWHIPVRQASNLGAADVKSHSTATGPRGLRLLPPRKLPPLKRYPILSAAPLPSHSTSTN